MNRLLLEIYADGSTDGNGAPPGLLISTRDPGDPADPAHAVTAGSRGGGGNGGAVVVLHLLEGGCVVRDPGNDGMGGAQPVAIGQWLEASGWRLRVTHGDGGAGAPAPAAASVGGGGGDESNWAAPEIRVTTYDGDRAKTVRAMLPTDEAAQLVVGRGGPGTDLVIEDDHVSRVHMRFFVRDGKRMVEDMGSRWGTRLNGEPLTEPAALKHGDELRLGKSTVQYVCYWDMMPASGAFSIADVQQAPPPSGGVLAAGMADRGRAGPSSAGGGISDTPSDPVIDKNPPPGVKDAEPPKPPPPPKPVVPDVAPIRPEPVKAPDDATPLDAAVDLTPTEPAAKPATGKKPAPRRSRGGLDIVGAALLVLVVLAAIGYLVYLVFFTSK